MEADLVRDVVNVLHQRGVRILGTPLPEADLEHPVKVLLRPGDRPRSWYVEVGGRTYPYREELKRFGFRYFGGSWPWVWALPVQEQHEREEIEQFLSAAETALAVRLATGAGE